MKFHSLQESNQKGASNYLKIADGENVVVIPRGEIYGFKVKWEGGKSSEIPESDSARHNRFKVNVLVKENDKYVAKVWEFGVMIYNTLASFAEEMEIVKTKIKVSRKGTLTDTIYTLVPLGQIDSAQLQSIEAVKLNILGGAVKRSAPMLPSSDLGPPPDWTTEPAPYDDSDLPF